MAKGNESRTVVAHRRPSENVIGEDVAEHTPQLAHLQASWLTRRLGLSGDRARVVAGLFFGCSE